MGVLCIGQRKEFDYEDISKTDVKDLIKRINEFTEE